MQKMSPEETARRREGLAVYRKTKKHSRTFMFTPADGELIEWGADYLGTSHSEFMRTALRAYVMSLRLK